jgi:predicted NAD/FAD-dependent oxidoreductase
MATQLAGGLTIRTETKIKQTYSDAIAWHLTDDQDQKYGFFDYLVLSLPAPQTLELLGNHPLAAEVKAVPMTPCWAVMLSFERSVDVPWDGAFVRNSPLAWVARNSSKPGRDSSIDCWVLHGTPDWSASHLESSRETVAKMLIAEFAAITSAPLPKLSHCDAHRWLYSATPISLNQQTWFSTDNKLVICGDWLAGGRIEGAFHSGVAAATCILDSYDKARHGKDDQEIP